MTSGLSQRRATSITTFRSTEKKRLHRLARGHSRVDRLTYSEEGSYSWRRSIAVNTERMYVADLEWDEDWMSSNSTIQVVDISDPDGDIREGASVGVAGQIEIRWQKQIGVI